MSRLGPTLGHGTVRHLVIAALSAAIAMMSAPSRAAEAVAVHAEIQPPFDVAAVRAAFGTKPKKRFACPPVPTPVASLDVESKYAPDGKSATIDPERLKAYQAVTAKLKAFTGPLIKLANSYVRSKPADGRIAVCAAGWLSDWAAARAIEMPPDRRGEALRAWTLPVLALAYVQIRSDKSLSEADRQSIESWIRRLADRVQADFSLGADLPSRQNNHRYWAGWAVMTSAAALSDRVMFDWAVASARVGLDAVTPDGFLPLELERQKRSLGYHVFAAEALVLLAEGAVANGLDLYAENDKALERLVLRTLAGLTDPAPFDAKVGVPQETDISAASSKLAWVAIADRRLESDVTQSWRKRLKNFGSLTAGGDVRLLFPPEPPVEKASTQ